MHSKLGRNAELKLRKHSIFFNKFWAKIGILLGTNAQLTHSELGRNVTHAIRGHGIYVYKT